MERHELLQNAMKFHAWAAEMRGMQGDRDAANSHARTADFYGDEASKERLRQGLGI